MLRPILAALALLSLACAGVDQPAQPTGYGQPGATPMQPAQPAGYGQPGTGAPPQNAYTIQGPVQGDDGAVMWVDSYGRITGMYPDQGFIMFGANDQLTYARDPYGTWYGVQGGQLIPLAGMPPELMSWPGVQTMLPGGYTLPAPAAPPTYAGGGGGYDPSIQVMQNINDMYHETNMTIIDNMAPEQVDYYGNDGQYLGTW